jgi:hypothetical protein
MPTCPAFDPLEKAIRGFPSIGYSGSSKPWAKPSYGMWVQMHPLKKLVLTLISWPYMHPPPSPICCTPPPCPTGSSLATTPTPCLSRPAGLLAHWPSRRCLPRLRPPDRLAARRQSSTLPQRFTIASRAASTQLRSPSHALGARAVHRHPTISGPHRRWRREFHHGPLCFSKLGIDETFFQKKSTRAS